VREHLAAAAAALETPKALKGAASAMDGSGELPHAALLGGGGKVQGRFREGSDSGELPHAALRAAPLAAPSAARPRQLGPGDARTGRRPVRSTGAGAGSGSGSRSSRKPSPGGVRDELR